METIAKQIHNLKGTVHNYRKWGYFEIANWAQEIIHQLETDSGYVPPIPNEPTLFKSDAEIEY
jgi:hypothetical protein